MIKNINKLHGYAKARDDKKFNTLFKILTIHSKAFRWAMLNKTEPDWMKKWSVRKLFWVMGRTNYILKEGRTNFKYKRVMIPKADGSQRPLSVPPLEWRIASKWLNYIFNIWIDASKAIADNQFGSVMNRNTAKAWDKLWKETVKAKFIAEFDIAKCFDSIKWDRIDAVIYDMKTPVYLHNWIYRIIVNASYNLPIQERDKEQDVVKEAKKWSIIRTEWKMTPVAKKMELMEYQWNVFWEETKKGWIAKDSRRFIWMVRQMMMDEHFNKNEKVKELARRVGVILPTDSAWNDEFPDLEGTVQQAGIPQGWALSPTIANIVMGRVAKEVKQGIFYMDDGLLWGEKPEEIPIPWMNDELRPDGLALAPKKFGWVKWEGQWVKTLKFLGAKYDGKVWSAETKKGSKIVLEKPKDLMSFWGNYIEENNKPWVENVFSKMKTPNCIMAYFYNNGRKWTKEGWVKINSKSLWAQVHKKWVKEYNDRIL